MDPLDRQQAERAAQKEQSDRVELVERIARAIPADGNSEPMKGIVLFSSTSPTESMAVLSYPALCIIAQGSKMLNLGGERFRYDPYHYLLGTVKLPVVCQIVEASKEQPYLSLRVDLDPTLVGSVMIDSGHVAPPSPTDVKAIDVSSLDSMLLDAVVRLVKLLDSPTDAQFLAPLIKREIIYHLLMGKQGERLRHIAVLHGYTPHIARAIERLREEFDQPLRIDEIARELGMSVSGFHHHFKSVAGMSPLQFQKQTRLQEARRLLFTEGLDAASVGYRVGYNDASHFNREYKKLFGVPPIRDIERLREAAGQHPARRAV